MLHVQHFEQGLVLAKLNKNNYIIMSSIIVSVSIERERESILHPDTYTDFSVCVCVRVCVRACVHVHMYVHAYMYMYARLHNTQYYESWMESG